MRKILVVVSVLAAIVVIGVGVGLLASRGTGHVPPPAPAEVVDNSVPQTAPAPTHVATHPQNPSPAIKPAVTQPPVIVAQPTNLAPAPVATGFDTNWEEKIDDIVGSDEPDTNKVQKLFALFPKLPPDGQEEAAQHLSNLVDDDAYKPLGEMLKNDKLSEDVLDELLADLLNRPNSLKLPLLLDLASNPNHAKHEESKDLLELYLGEDYGPDMSAWAPHMTNWLQQNPD